MSEKGAVQSSSSFFLGFDGGGTKTDCVLTDSSGQILARSLSGPSNPLRAGYMKAWFVLGEAADVVLSHEKITVAEISGICAGLGGAGRPGVARRVASFLKRSYPNAQIRVTSDMEIALAAAFDDGDGIILLAGTGSAAFGRDATGRNARAGGRGPWFSDEGSSFDIGRNAFRAITLADEHRGPATALSDRILAWHQTRDWDSLLEFIAKSPDGVFPATFPLVAELADAGDEVSRDILRLATVSLAELANCVARELDFAGRELRIAKVGGMYGRSQYFDQCVQAEVRKALPHARLVTLALSPAAAAARIAIRIARAKGHAA